MGNAGKKRVFRIVGWSFFGLFVLAVGVGAWALHVGIDTSLNAEANLHAVNFTIRLVEQFVGEHGRWPLSWGELEAVSIPAGTRTPFGESNGWPEASAELQKRVHIDFDADLAAIATQDKWAFSAIKPIGSYYEYCDYGNIDSLKAAIQKYATPPPPAPVGQER